MELFHVKKSRLTALPFSRTTIRLKKF